VLCESFTICFLLASVDRHGGILPLICTAHIDTISFKFFLDPRQLLARFRRTSGDIAAMCSGTKGAIALEYVGYSRLGYVLVY